MKDTWIIHKSENTIVEEQWKNLMKSDTANFFQTKQALAFFEDVGIETFIFAVEKNDKLTALISGIIQKEKGIKANFTSRAIVYGGPALSDQITSSEVSELLKSMVLHLKKKSIYLEIRNLNNYEEYKNVFKEVGFEFNPHLNFHLDCTDELAMRKRMSSSKLRQVKKSLKEGAKIIEPRSKQDIMAYYQILENLYKTKIKTPLPGLRFFIRLWEMQTSTFLLISFQDEIVGGIVCPVLKDKVIYEWFVCGKDREFNNVYPSVLATWAAMEYAVKNDIPRFDFMGAGKPEEDYGVREFKSKFGGEQVAHGRFLYIFQPLLYSVGKTAVKILKRT